MLGTCYIIHDSGVSVNHYFLFFVISFSILSIYYFVKICISRFLSLDTFPQSNQERNEGRYAGKGYRQLIIDNYMAIFRIDEPRKIVYVVTIQYQGRNL